MKNLKIGVRLGLGFTMVLALLVVIITMSLIRINDLYKNLDHLLGDYNQKQLIVSDIVSKVKSVGQLHRDALIIRTDEAIESKLEAAANTRKAVGAHFTNLQENFTFSEVGQKLYDASLGARTNYVAASLKLEELIRGKQWDVVLAHFTDVYTPANDAFLRANEAFIAFQVEAMIESGKEAAITTRNAQVLIIALGILSVLLGLIIALVITGSIVKPVNKVVAATDKMSKGEFDFILDVNSHDEIGAVAHSVRSVQIAVKGMADEAMMLSQAAVEGKLKTRADASRHQGDFRSVVQGVNATLDAVIGPLNVAAEYVERISKGDIPQKISDDYNGDFNQIKNNLNTCIEAVDKLVSDAGTLSQAAVDGRLDTRADASRHQGDFRKIVEGVNLTLDRVIEPVNEITAIFKLMSEGDLSTSMTGSYKGDFDVLKNALNTTIDAINDILSQVSMAVLQVSAGSQQVSQASQALSQGATEQASSLEEITSSVTEIAGQTRQNTDNAVQVNTLAKAAKADAEQGNMQMNDLVAAMKDINISAEEIRKIVKAIDDISFQINLLALNANVEAARAGKYGKGFAVVAEEVRNLAVRSAGSVKETTNMVDQAISNIVRGNKLVDVTSKQLSSIVGGAAKVATLAEEVAVAGREQSQGLEQISVGLGQIDQVTQSNTAGAEESASAAEELSSQAQQLKDMIARFKLKERETKIAHEDMIAMLRAELARERNQVPVEAKEPVPRGLALPAGKRSVNPADLIRLDDQDFGSF